MPVGRLSEISGISKNNSRGILTIDGVKVHKPTCAVVVGTDIEHNAINDLFIKAAYPKVKSMPGFPYESYTISHEQVGLHVVKKVLYATEQTAEILSDYYKKFFAGQTVGEIKVENMNVRTAKEMIGLHQNLGKLIDALARVRK